MDLIEPTEKELDRFLAGESSPAERKQIESWIVADAARADRFAQLPSILVAHAARRGWNVDRAYATVDSRIREWNRKIDITPIVRTFTAPWAHWRGLAVAAVALIVIASVLTFSSSRRGVATAATTAWTEIKTGPGETRALKLADGSLVKLGPMTTVRHTSRTGAVDVEMTGLAGFEITHDPKRTFTVRALAAEVIDIGTSFVVRAYSSDSAAMVVVTSGKVALSGRGPAASTTVPTVELSPGEGGVVLSDGTIIPGAPLGNEISDYLARLTGRLSFDALEMSDVAAEIGAWFGVQVVITDSTLANRRITAVFDKPTLSEVLDAIAETTGSRYETRAGVITFRSGPAR